MKKIKIAIIGASGYTGCELVRILLNHENAEITNLIANSNAGKKISEIYPIFRPFDLPILQNLEEVDFDKIDVAFTCLPHGLSQEIIANLAKDYEKLKIIDLSADFRIKNPQTYQEFYHKKHEAIDLQEKAVYGISEIYRQKIKKSNLIACAGCYPTSILLPLVPLIENKLVDEKNIVIDSKSGVSGAGRSLKESNLFCEVSNNFKAYAIGNHRHVSEIEQELKIANDNIELKIDFTPHLIAINRGILSTIYLDLKDNFTIDDVKNCLKTRYEDEYFVNFYDEDVQISNVLGSNFCEISVKKARSGKIIITSAIDNLCKGASGQAVQNMNIIFGLDERTGLKFTPIFP